MISRHCAASKCGTRTTHYTPCTVSQTRAGETRSPPLSSINASSPDACDASKSERRAFPRIALQPHSAAEISVAMYSRISSSNRPPRNPGRRDIHDFLFLFFYHLSPAHLSSRFHVRRFSFNAQTYVCRSLRKRASYKRVTALLRPLRSRWTIHVSIDAMLANCSFGIENRTCR